MSQQSTFFVVFMNDMALSICVDKLHAEREKKFQMNLLKEEAVRYLGTKAPKAHIRHYISTRRIHYCEIEMAPLNR